ncbi:Ribonuclease VapC22 [Moraxella lacunata]|uniref:Ribonuclease VapC22 n=1 Tax=Moraxella lacunata TaxID=477 RepID=A0A378T8J4_MORLA|nr:type II toxin-antitoxin system VapC family toxin [Moraxella lacunata]STZ56183.1 Ribonuclease VapC22 [Moraxella lacunata]
MVLLDTHIWYRWQYDDLPKRILDPIQNADRIFVSATSCWEIAQLVKRKRLELPMSAEQWVSLASVGIEILPINKEIAMLTERLGNHHKDPADRFIIATSVFYQIPMISLDMIFPKYDELKSLLIH